MPQDDLTELLLFLLSLLPFVPLLPILIPAQHPRQEYEVIGKPKEEGQSRTTQAVVSFEVKVYAMVRRYWG